MMNPSYTELLQELEIRDTTDERRKEIGEALAHIGDPRPGVGVKGSVPDIAWVPVNPGGEAEIKRVWQPETPDEQARIIDIHRFHVKPFYIAKYLVTYGQYQVFVEAEDGIQHSKWWAGMPELFQRQKLAEQRTKLLNNPRDTISWYQSIGFARWINQQLEGFEIPHPSGEGVMQVGNTAEIRLPTEWEWQWAAQNGVEARTYPWGERKIGYANTAESGLKQAITVGLYPQGAAGCGAMDMAGNLMEWCINDKVDIAIIDVESTASKVLRGGDWGFGIENATCIYADDEAPGQIDTLNGFRLALVPISNT